MGSGIGMDPGFSNRGTLRNNAARIERVKVTVHGRPVAVRDPEAARDAVAALFANRVVAL